MPNLNLIKVKLSRFENAVKTHLGQLSKMTRKKLHDVTFTILGCSIS